MNDIPNDLRNAPPQSRGIDAGRRGFDRAAAFRGIGFSLIFNALFPYLLFRALAPRFPAESVLPLLYATAFPVIGFLSGVVRKRTLDAIALIALFGIAIQISVTVLSANVSTALVLRSFQGALIGLGFLASAAIGRPVILYVARQFVAAGTHERRAAFDAVAAAEGGRAFRVATIVWGSGLIVMSAVHVALAIELPHAEYLLVSPILGVVADVVLLAWSFRYITKRVTPFVSAAA